MQGDLEVGTDFSFPQESTPSQAFPSQGEGKVGEVFENSLLIVMLEKSVVSGKKVLIQSQWNQMKTTISFHTSRIKLHLLCCFLLWL